MSQSLDDMLREIVEEIPILSGNRDLAQADASQETCARLDKAFQDKAITQIKQAFLDAGYEQSKNTVFRRYANLDEVIGEPEQG